MYKFSTHLVLLALVLTAFVSAISAVPTVDEYLRSRSQIFQEESDVRLGSNLRLDDAREILVNDILMSYKGREYTEGLDSNGAHFASAQHFFHTKPMIEASNVFKIIRLLPKGAGLHMHDVTIPSVEFVATNLTYMDDLYYCYDGKTTLMFHFYGSQPTEECLPGQNWGLVSELRAASSSPEFIDSWFTESMSLFTPQPVVDYPNINAVWKVFEEKILTIAGIANYLPAMRKHFYRTLTEFHEDNVMYIEQRGLLEGIYTLNQTLLGGVEILGIYEEVVQEFMKNHQDFWGAKYIYAPHRFHEPAQVSNMINQAVEMKAKYPNFFAGFDLVGQEDLGTPLLGFLSELLDAASKDIKFFFHAGETAWHGTKIDENLVDAILLNTTRLGHAYALASHPLLAQEVQNKGIAVESCPISNQVLKLVDDFRNHPAIPLMKEGFPLVIASDNPGMWGAKGISHDWYIAFMAMAGGKADLRFLKQLALNSIEYSAMTTAEKEIAYTKWTVSWSVFLDRVIAFYDPSFNDIDNVIPDSTFT